MTTTAQRLNSVKTSKEDIRQAIANKGITIPSTTPLSEYSDKINEIFTSETLRVTLTVTDIDDVDPYTLIPDAEVTVKYASTSETKSLTDDLPYVEFTIPKNESYSISFSPTEYAPVHPPMMYFKAGSEMRTITATYMKSNISSFIINDNITDPATKVTEEVGAIDDFTWIRNNSHRYLGKKTADGTVTICQLMDTDGTKYADGTDASTDLATVGIDCFMKLPKFWWRCILIAPKKHRIEFSAEERTEIGWKLWSGNDLIGVYESYTDTATDNTTGKAYSVSGVTPNGSICTTSWKQKARNRGTGYSLVKWEHHCMMAALFFCKYEHTNAQAKCGVGVSSYEQVAGGTNTLGMTDTTATTGANSPINFWGLEHWWGSKYEWVDNVIVNSNNTYTVTNGDSTRNTVPACKADGYISELAFGEHLDIISTQIHGSTATGYCDYVYNDSSASMRAVARSYGGAYVNGGVAYVSSNYALSSALAPYGSRLAFSGTIVTAESVASFQALPEEPA